MVLALLVEKNDEKTVDTLENQLKVNYSINGSYIKKCLLKN